MGFDEYMNLVLDDAEEIKQVRRFSLSLQLISLTNFHFAQDESKLRTPLGRIMLKGDNISVLQNAEVK